ncbi:MAG: peptidase S41 [Chitinophagaceae bacterium]|nr:peptidase S41 [Chitinophagaceae bacterium]
MRKYLEPGGFHSLVQYCSLVLIAFLCTFCSSSRKGLQPNRRYPPAQLQKDYTLFRNILEESHPSLYWFTSKDSMDHYFNWGYSQINDSMNERDFRMILSYVITKIRCGHTSIRPSKKYNRYLDTAKLKLFPLSLKIWDDTMVVTSNINRRDSILKRGTIITAIEDRSAAQLIDTLLNYVTGDGFATIGKYQSLSNRGNFATLYRNVFGLPDTLQIQYLDSSGELRNTFLKAYDPRDTAGKLRLNIREPGKREIRQRELVSSRNVQIDPSLGSAYMTVNTFSRGNRLKGFFKKSFRRIDKLNLQHLVIDVRANGGGDAGISTLLTQYLIDEKFKIADSLYTVKRSSRYRSHIKWQRVYWLMTRFVTRKHSDGNYHFGYFERHYFKPRKKHHFNGNIYLLTGGNSFSATTLVLKALQGQSNVKIIGEETGGGAYGNTAWMIPDVVLPETGVRFRLPKFRLVMDKDLVKNGRGVMPDIYVRATPELILRGIDPKIEVVKDIIKKAQPTTTQRQ